MKESSPLATKAQAPLSPEQKSILASKSFNLNRRPGELIDLLTPIATRDRAADRTRHRFGVLAALTPLFTILAVLLLSFPGYEFLLPYALALGFAVFLVGLIMWLKLRSSDLSNNLGETVLPILSIFREDFARDQPVHLKVDLSPPKARSKKQRQTDPYQMGGRKVVDAFYFDPWMEGTAMLNDGSAMSWTVADTIRVRKCTKRNRRGKYKVKTKMSRKTRIDVHLGLKKTRYNVTPPPDATMKSGEKRDVVSLRRTVRKAGDGWSDVLDPISPKVFVDMFADIYRGVKLAGSGA